MARCVLTQVFEYSELSNSAKEKAREWFTSTIDQSDYADSVIEDAIRMGEILGIEIDGRPVRLMNGQTRQEPNVSWTGFYSQGDGASFTGRYSYQKGSLAAIKKEAPRDAELHRIAHELAKVQKRYFYRLKAQITTSGRYSHSRTMSASVEDSENELRDIGAAESEIEELVRSFADWIFSNLRNEYEYQTSEECVSENIEANAYEFDENGNIA